MYSFRHVRESIPSRGASPVTFSLDSNSPPVYNSSPTATQGLIIATLKFEDDTGAVLRPDKLVTFPRFTLLRFTFAKSKGHGRKCSKYQIWKAADLLMSKIMCVFSRIATMANVEERLRTELPQTHQTKSFDVRLGDGREADAEIPLVSLGEPLVIVCRLHKPTAEVLYKSRGGWFTETLFLELQPTEEIFCLKTFYIIFVLF